MSDGLLDANDQRVTPLAFARRHRIIAALLALIGMLAIAAPALIVITAPKIAPRRHHVVALPKRVVPQAEIPPVEPVNFQALDPDDARVYNAGIPFVDGPNPAARPFHLTGADDDEARAIDCMAAAVLYEAGDDTTGERAVAQVIINRVRHPAFPKTICGVVFQGSERNTGCQFTFTCDGALSRWKPSDAAWDRARTVALQALTGTVEKTVGYATHYHTDWVVPYWSSSLDKVAKVGTHLFFRWTGWWGTPPAFHRHVLDTEPVIAALAAFSDAHASIADAEGPADTVTATAFAGTTPVATVADGDSFLVTVDPATPAAAFAALATQSCGDRPYCKLMAWTSKANTPAALPLDPKQIASMAFSYLRDRAHGYEKALWNCTQFPRPDAAQCMKVQIFLPTAADPARKDGVALKGLAPSGGWTLDGRPDGLNGVRHKREGTPPPVVPTLPTASPAPVPKR